MAVATGQGTGIAWADDDPGAGTNETAPSAETPSDTGTPGAGAPTGTTPATGTTEPGPDPAADDPDLDADVDLDGPDEGGTEGDDDGQIIDVDADLDSDELTPPTSTPDVAVGPQPDGISAEPNGAAVHHDSQTPSNAAPDAHTSVFGGEDNSTNPAPSTGVPDVGPSAFAPQDDVQNLGSFTASDADVEFTTLSDPAPTANPTTSFAGAVVSVATTLINAFFSPFLSPADGDPAEPPLLWAVLAFVRREFSRTFFNTTPNAVADAVTTSEGVPTLIDVLGNDIDDDTLSVTSFTQPEHGAVVLNEDGSFTYTPGENFSGTDTFSYTVSDAASGAHFHGFFGLFGGGHTDSDTVTITVTPVDDSNSAPTDVQYTPGETDPETGTVTGTVSAHDDDGDTLTYTVTSGPDETVGSVSIDAESGEFTFTPTPDARYAASLTSGEDPVTVTVAVSDGEASTALDIQVLIAPQHPADDGTLSISDLDGLFERGDITFSENSDGTVRVIDGRFTDDIVLNAADAADVLNKIAGVLGAPADFADEADISSAQLVQLAADDTEVTETFYRLRQTINGVPVLGDDVILVTDGAGKVTSLISSNSTKLRDVDTVPDAALDDQSEAVAAATSALVEDLATELDPADVDAFLATLMASGDLVVYDLDSSVPPSLVWRVSIATNPESAPDPAVPVVRATYYVFANGAATGSVLSSASDVDTASTQGRADIRIYKSDNEDDVPGSPVTEQSSEWNASYAAALANATETYEYYLNVLGRNSFDGVGGDIRVNVFPNDVENAYWYKDLHQLSFGNDWEKSLDVVGHELTHGVINYVVGDGRTQSLGGNQESNALNEAYADIMGSLIEQKSKTEAGRWLIGEGGLYTIRSMAEPTDYTVYVRELDALRFQPGDMRDYINSYDGHVNSGIINHAAYTMMTDPDAAGISDETWARLFYNSMYRLPSDASFLDARAALISSAKALRFTPEQQSAVADGFASVGIQEQDEFKIILRWDNAPADLDAHLIGPSATGAGEPFHVYFGDQAYYADGSTNSDDAALAADLDYDDVDSYGPERITIRQLTPGEYTFVVHDFSNRFSTDSSALAKSGAYVKVYQGTSIRPAVFRVDGGSEGTSWTVFKLTISGTEDNYSWTITPVNAYSYGSPEIDSTTRGVSLPGLYTYNSSFSPDGTKAIVTSNVQGTDDTVVTFVNATSGKKLGNSLLFNERVNAEFNPTGTRTVVVSQYGALDATRVSVFDTTTFDQIGTTLTVPGFYGGGDMLFDDSGTRLAIPLAHDDAGETSVVLIDLETGAQLGDGASVPGGLWATPGFSPDGSRFTFQTEAGGGEFTTRLAVLDTATGDQIGSTAVLAGRSNSYVSPDGERIMVVGDARLPDAARIMVIDTVTGTQVGSTVMLAGEVPSSSADAIPVITANGRAVVTTEAYGDSLIPTTRLVVIDTRTGTLVSDSFTHLGTANQTLVSADGTRAVIAGMTASTQTEAGQNWVAVIDTSTGAQVGDLITAPDGTLIAVKANPSGTRVTVAVMDNTALTNKFIVLNTTTGTQIGQTLTLSGQITDAGASFSADGTRAVFVTNSYTTGTRATVFDTTTGTVVGSVSVAPPGQTIASYAQVSTDGTRATITQASLNGMQYVTRILVLDTVTGNLIGQPVEMAGASTTPPVVTADESRAVMKATNTVYDQATGQLSVTTTVAVIDMATGRQVGDTIEIATGPNIAGANASAVMLTPDGTRAVVTGSDYSSTGGPVQNLKVAVIDTATGRQVGETAVIDGIMSSSDINAQSTRATFTVNVISPPNTVDSEVVVIDLVNGP
jgi:VCBS repeat-containing protein